MHMKLFYQGYVVRGLNSAVGNPNVDGYLILLVECVCRAAFVVIDVVVLWYCILEQSELNKC